MATSYGRVCVCARGRARARRGDVFGRREDVVVRYRRRRRSHDRADRIGFGGGNGRAPL